MFNLDGGGDGTEDRLSSWMDGDANKGDSQPKRSEHDDEYLIDKAVISAVHAFAIRWLSTQDTVMDADGESAGRMRMPDEHIRNTLWHQATRAVYPAMTRPSYRSVLALHLVAITAPSIDHKDHGIETLCSEVSLSHHLHLKTASQRAEPCLFSNDVAPSWDLLRSYGDQQAAGEVTDRAKKQGTAYWLGIVSDTARSVTKCRPSILLPGRSGDTKVWNYVRQRTAMLDPSFRSLHGTQQPISDEVVATILQHATACKSMCWWTITRVQDALFHRIADESVEQALESTVTDFRQYHDLFDPLMEICARDFMILNHQNQLHYCEYLMWITAGGINLITKS